MAGTILRARVLSPAVNIRYQIPIEIAYMRIAAILISLYSS